MYACNNCGGQIVNRGGQATCQYCGASVELEDVTELTGTAHYVAQAAQQRRELEYAEFLREDVDDLSYEDKCEAVWKEEGKTTSYQDRCKAEQDRVNKEYEGFI